jgi:phosphoglycolate phosphatase-like HAD superfamily hydrolase
MTTNAAVILDVDGTLVDSNDAHARAWVDAFEAHGVTVAFDPVRRSIGMGGDKLMPAVAGIEEDTPLGKKISEARARYFKERYLPQIRSFAGTRALVQRLADDGYTLAVASSAKEDELNPLLQIAGVTDLVSHQTSSDDAEESKPEPDIVQAALKQAKAAPGDAIMLGDTPYDVEAAGRSGVKIVALECGGWSFEDLKGAVEVYSDPADLLAKYDGSILARLAPRSSSPSHTS